MGHCLPCVLLDKRTIRLSRAVTTPLDGTVPSQSGALPCETAAGVFAPLAPLFLDAAFMDCEACESVVEAPGESANVKVGGAPVRTAVKMMVKTADGLISLSAV